MNVQADFKGNLVKPWKDVCCKSCYYASGKRCECRCGGVFHGAGNNHGKLKNKKDDEEGVNVK